MAHRTVQVRAVSAGCVTDILYPHDVFALLHSQYPDKFRLHVSSDTSTLTQFWENLLQTDYGRHLATCSPALAGKSPSQLRHCVPLILHGDGVPYSKKHSALFCQWGSLTGSRIA